MSSLTDIDVERLGQREIGDTTELQAMTADVAVAAVKKMLRQRHHRCKITYL